MKTINKINSVIMIGLGLLISSSVQAQDKYKTNERIGTQLVENSAPGLKYGPESQKKQQAKTVSIKQDTKGNIRDILFTQGIPSPTSQASRTTRTTLNKSVPSKLPSDAKAAEKEEKKTEAPKPSLPTQGDEKKVQ